ncbi:MAG TPA: hemolysin family protein [Acidimicrobiia bacterium]
MIVAFATSVALVLVAGALRAGGASLVRTSRADALHDYAEGNPAAGVVARLLEDRARLQPAVGMVHSGLLVAAAVPATWALTELFSGWGLVVSLILLAIALVAIGDVIPRGVGRRNPRILAYRFAFLLERAVGLGGAAADLMSDEEPREMEPEPVDGQHERALISSVLEFSETLVREVMVPRTDMVVIDKGVSTDEALDLFIQHGYSRIPVVATDGTEDVVGIVYAKDLLQLMDRGEGAKPVVGVMREAYFVPETKRVPDLLRDMQASKIHIAVVVDEFGGIAGLVTIEDLLEELVGEIADEYDSEEPYVVELPEGGFLLDARLSVDELNDLLGLELPRDEWDTVGGLILDLAGRVPREGERFDAEGVILIAQRVQGRRVAQVRAVTKGVPGAATGS